MKLPGIKIKPKRKSLPPPPPPRTTIEREHFDVPPSKPMPIAMQAMQAIQRGEIASNRSNFDRDFAHSQYSLPLQGPDITPPRQPQSTRLDSPTRFDNSTHLTRIENYTAPQKKTSHTTTFVFGLALIGIVVLGFYFGKKKQPLY